MTNDSVPVEPVTAEAGKVAANPIQPLSYLDRNLATLAPALARAARYILENPEKVIRYSLKDLSGFSRTGEASIIRLCHALGVTGYGELKIALAQELAVREREPAQPAGKRHRAEELARGLALSITDTLAVCDLERVSAVTERLRKCNRIDIYGSGVSGIVADLFSYRLLRAGLNAHAIRDFNLAHEVASSLGPSAAAIAISESGVTPDTVKFLHSARAAGAYTVAITSQERSQLADGVDAVLVMAKLRVPTFGGYITAVPRAIFLAEVIAMLAAGEPGSPKRSKTPRSVTKVK